MTRPRALLLLVAVVLAALLLGGLVWGGLSSRGGTGDKAIANTTPRQPVPANAAAGTAPATAGNAAANSAANTAANSTANMVPDITHGAAIAQGGAQGGVTACVGCHGARGEGNAQAAFPRLAGQTSAYLRRQMRSFSDGSRANSVMSPIAKAMQPQQMLDVSAWYASLDSERGDEAGSTAGAKPAEAVLERGRLLATTGSESLRVQACANCHGPKGAGEAPDYPALAGQHASYLTAAMAEWKTGARKTDPGQQMPLIAQSLNDDDVAALAAYYAAQRAPPTSAQENNLAAGTLARPAIAAAADAAGPRGAAGGAAGAAGAVTAGAAATGTGTEQGAPLTGGNQGPGGGGGTNAANANANANTGTNANATSNSEAKRKPAGQDSQQR